MGKITRIADKIAKKENKKGESREENRVEFCFEQNGERVFYVKFYEDELLKEMKDLKNYYSNIRKGFLDITEKDGTFRISSKSMNPATNGIPMPDAWDILMHKYFALSHQVRRECGIRYYPIRFSDSFISPELTRIVC